MTEELLLGCEILTPLTDEHYAVLDALQCQVVKLRLPMPLSDLTALLDRYPSVTEVVIRGVSEQYASAEDCWNDIRDGVLTCLNRGLVVWVEPGNEPNHPDAPEGALGAAQGIIRDLLHLYAGQLPIKILSIPLAAIYGPQPGRSRALWEGKVGETVPGVAGSSAHVYFQPAGFGLGSWSGFWHEQAAIKSPVIVSELAEERDAQGVHEDRRYRVGQVLQAMAKDGRVHAVCLFMVGSNEKYDYLNVSREEAAYYRSLIASPQTGGEPQQGGSMDKQLINTNLDIIWGTTEQMEAKATVQLAQNIRNAVISIKDAVATLPDPQTAGAS